MKEYFYDITVTTVFGDISHKVAGGLVLTLPTVKIDLSDRISRINNTDQIISIHINELTKETEISYTEENEERITIKGKIVYNELSGCCYIFEENE